MSVPSPCCPFPNFLSHIGHAVVAATHIINRLPTPGLHNRSPWELLFHSVPDLTHLRVFGCTYFPLLRPYDTHKLQPHTKPCIFLGYPAYSKGYICLEPSSHSIFISRHVLFNENELLCPESPPLSTGSSLSAVTSQFSTFPAWLSYLLHTSPSTAQPSPPIVPVPTQATDT